MIERALYALAAFATVAGFLLEVWRMWKGKREKKREDNAERKSDQQ